MLDKTTGGVCPYAEAEEGLRQTYGPGAFINSPYGDGLPAWCEKVQQGAAAGTPTLALLPCGARFWTGHWQEHVLCGELNALCFIPSPKENRRVQQATVKDQEGDASSVRVST